MVRSLFYVAAGDRTLGDYSGRALNAAHKLLPQIPEARLKAMASEQFFVLMLYPEHAVRALAVMVPSSHQRRELLKTITNIVTTGGPLTPAGRKRLDEVASALDMSADVVSTVHH